MLKRRLEKLQRNIDGLTHKVTYQVVCKQHTGLMQVSQLDFIGVEEEFLEFQKKYPGTIFIVFSMPDVANDEREWQEFRLLH